MGYQKTESKFEILDHSWFRRLWTLYEFQRSKPLSSNNGIGYVKL